jgi:hypothetical protein
VAGSQRSRHAPGEQLSNCDQDRTSSSGACAFGRSRTYCHAICQIGEIRPFMNGARSSQPPQSREEERAAAGSLGALATERSAVRGDDRQ